MVSRNVYRKSGGPSELAINVEESRQMVDSLTTVASVCASLLEMHIRATVHSSVHSSVHSFQSGHVQWYAVAGMLELERGAIKIPPF